MPVPPGLHKSRTQQLLTERGHDLDALIAEWRETGDGWAAISDRLAADYGIDVSRWTLARWYTDTADAA